MRLPFKSIKRSHLRRTCEAELGAEKVSAPLDVAGASRASWHRLMALSYAL